MPQLSQRSWKYHVDIPLCMMCFAITLTENVLIDFIIYRTCYVTLGHNQTECALLNSKSMSNNTELGDEVQPVAALFTMSKTIIQSVIPALLGMFLGPWSDKHGRKPLIVCPIIGYMINLCIIVALTFFSNASPIFVVLAAIPMSFSGGLTAMLTGIFCYIGDIVPVNNRAVRIGILHGILSLGLMSGSLCSGLLLSATNYTTVFATGALILFFTACYTIFLIPESVRNETEPEGIFGLVDCNLVFDLWSTCFKKRTENRRLAIWLILFTLGLMVFQMDGKFQLDYLFVKEKFHWTLEQYSVYSALNTMTGITASMLGIYILNKVFKISETILALVSFVSAFSIYVIRAFATSSWEMYVTIPAGMFEGMGSPMCRTILSRMVPETELGKVFAMASSIEALMPLISAPTFTFIYNKTLTTFTGAFYLLCAAAELTNVLFFCIVFVAIRNISTSNILPVKLDDDQDEDEDESNNSDI